jgi:hypothetical protein
MLRRGQRWRGQRLRNRMIYDAMRGTQGRDDKLEHDVVALLYSLNSTTQRT